MRQALRIARGRDGAAYDARMHLRIGGTPVVLETEALLIERLTRSAAPWSALRDASPEEAALLFERLCASDVTALERALGVTVMVEELHFGAPGGGGADAPLLLRVGLEDGDYAVRLDAASALWRERIGALLSSAMVDAGPGGDEATVALGPIEHAAEALATAGVGDLVLIAGAGETLRAVVWTSSGYAPARLGVDVLALEAAFAPRPGGFDPSGYVEIGRLACDRQVAPGVELGFTPYDADRARYLLAGRVRAIGRLVNSDGDLAFVIDELKAG